MHWLGQLHIEHASMAAPHIEHLLTVNHLFAHQLTSEPPARHFGHLALACSADHVTCRAAQGPATDAHPSVTVPDNADAHALLSKVAGTPVELATAASAASSALQVFLLPDGSLGGKQLERAIAGVASKLQTRDHMDVATGVHSRAVDAVAKAASPEEATVASFCVDWCAESRMLRMPGFDMPLVPRCNLQIDTRLHSAVFLVTAQVQNVGALCLMQRLTERCMCSAARRAHDLLANDKQDDLYFEGGQVRGGFLKRIASGQVSAAFVRHIVACAPSDATAMWKEILHAAFGALNGFSFTGSLDELNAQLGTIAALTSDATLLRLVAAMLMEEVVVLNQQAAQSGVGALGRAFEARGGGGGKAGALLAPLLAASGWVDPVKVERAARTGRPIEGLLPASLADVRGYPGSRCAFHLSTCVRACGLSLPGDGLRGMVWVHQRLLACAKVLCRMPHCKMTTREKTSAMRLQGQRRAGGFGGATARAAVPRRGACHSQACCAC